MTETTTISDKEKAVIYAEMAKAVNRLAGTLTDDLYKLSVLQFISDRTFGFQKLSEVILERHFLNGVKSAANGITCAGLKMSAAKLYDCLRWAREQGIVVTTKSKRKVRYAIKRERVLALVSPKKRDRIAAVLSLTDDEWGAEEPREHLHAVEVSAAGYLHEVEVHSKNHSPYGVREEEKRSARTLAPVAGPGASPFSDRGEGASAPVEAAPAVQPVPAQPVRTASPTPKTAKVAKRDRLPPELWARTMFDRFAAVARATWPEMGCLDAPTAKQRGQLRNLSKGWTHPRIKFLDFLEWCAANWRGVWASKMRLVRTTDPAFQFTDHPDIGTLIYFHKAFRDSYDRRESQRIRAGLTREDDLVRRFMFSGFSHADALIEAQRVMAKDKKREDLDARAKQINEVAARLQAKEQDIDNRIAIGKSYIADYQKRLKNQTTPSQPIKPKGLFRTEAEIFAPLPPLPPMRPFKDHHDDPDEAPELAADLVPGQPPSLDPVQAGGHL